MRRLARELNVTPGALYWHFANKQAAARRRRRPDPAARGRRRRRGAAGATASSSICSAPARCPAVVHRRRRTGVGELRRGPVRARWPRSSTRLTDAAAEAGIDAAERRAGRPHACVYYVLGFTADEQSRLQWDAAGAICRRASRCWPTDPNARFAFGLGLLVDGIGAAQHGSRLSRSRVLDLGVAVPAAAARERARRGRRPTDRPPAPAPAVGASTRRRQRDVRRPLPGIGVRQRARMHVRQHSSVHLGVHASSSADGTTRRTSVNGPLRRTTSARRCRQRSGKLAQPAAAAHRRRAGRHRVGDGQRHVRAVGRRPVRCLARQPRLGQVVPDLPDRGLGVADRRAARPNGPSAHQTRDPAGSNAAALSAANSAGGQRARARRAAPRAAAPAAPAPPVVRLGGARIAPARRRRPVPRTKHLAQQALPRSARCG